MCCLQFSTVKMEKNTEINNDEHCYFTAPRNSYDHCTCRPDKIPVEEGIVCDESFTSNCTEYTTHSNEFTSNSTESMGDLLSRGDRLVSHVLTYLLYITGPFYSCSIASSSGVSSSSGTGPSTKRSQSIPGPIDNSNLVAEPLYKVGTLTGEGNIYNIIPSTTYP